MKGMGYHYEGHDSGTKRPSKAPTGYSSPATHCDISSTSTSVNQKSPSGHKGGEQGSHGGMGNKGY